MPIGTICHFSAVKALLDATETCEEANRISNVEDGNTNTPLHLSAIHGHACIAKLFIECGADIDAK